MDFTTTSRVILSGASGMLGKAVRRALDTNLIPSLQLVRRKRARPDPVTNADFTRVLARRLRRPAFLSVPQVAMKLLFGQMANEALLASACVKPGSSSTRDSIFPSRIWIRRSQQRFENERDRTLPLPQGTECPKSIRRGLSYRRPWITRPVDAVTLPFFLAARFTARSCISCPSFDLLIETCMIRLMMLPVIQ
jgi:hypothetical protein